MTSICSEMHWCLGYFSDVDSVLLRMTIIGVLLSFRNLAQEALNDVSMNLFYFCTSVMILHP